MGRSIVCIVLVISVAVAFAAQCDAVDASEEETPQAIYGYQTHGNAHPNYWCEITSIESSERVLYIVSVLEGYDVTRIGFDAGMGLEGVEVLVIPERVEEIAGGAFDSCDSLDRVYFLGPKPSMGGAFPDDVAMVSLEGWQGSETMRVVSDGGVSYAEIEGELMTIGGQPDGEGRIIIADDVEGMPVTSVGPYSFAGEMQENGEVSPYIGLMSVELGDNVVAIRERAFYYNSDLASITFPEGLRSIMDEAFRMAVALESIDLPTGLESIGFECFRGCSTLSEAEVPSSVDIMGEGVFKLCSSLQSAVLHAPLVPAWMFHYCSSLEEVSIPEGTETIGAGAFYNCPSLSSVSLPESLEAISDSAFYNCQSLESVSLGGSVRSVGGSAFYECGSLESIVLPQTLESIGDRAFAYCIGLEEVTFEGPMPAFGRSVFLGCGPEVLVAEQYADGWSSFDGEVRVISDGDGGAMSWVVAVAVVIIAIIAVACGITIFRRHSG